MLSLLKISLQGSNANPPNSQKKMKKRKEPSIDNKQLCLSNGIEYQEWRQITTSVLDSNYWNLPKLQLLFHSSSADRILRIFISRLPCDDYWI